MLSPESLDLVPEVGPFTMTSLLDNCMARKMPVGAYRMQESWQDIGLPSEFQSAQRTEK